MNASIPLRISDDPDLLGVEELLAEGRKVITQFSLPIYREDTLARLNSFAKRYGNALQVRFYGLSHTGFDCAILVHMPSVTSLSIDSLQWVKNVELLRELPSLKVLRIGIQDGLPDDILESPALLSLEQLTLSGGSSKALDLAPIREMEKLKSLHVTAYTKGIASIAGHPRLETLSLSMISRKQRLGFVHALPALLGLSLILGGREEMNDVQSATVTALEVIRVKGLQSIPLVNFPALRYLTIEDQAKLSRLSLQQAPRLTSLRALNCTELTELDGFSTLEELCDARVAGTAIDFDSLVNNGLPRNLSAFYFHAKTAKLDRAIQQRLSALGYGDKQDA